MSKLNEFFTKIKGKKVALLGLGISNAPLVDFLLSHGVNVSVHDKKTRNGFDKDFINSLEARGVRLFLGETYLDDFDEDIILKAPGIRCDVNGLLSAISRGAWLTSEMELFFNLSDCTKYAITGSDGKTTTTTLTNLMLSKHYKHTDTNVYVGGNIGRPLFPIIESIKDSDIAVLELSSFQLHAMEVEPDACAITNVSPNHLDWHTDYEEYIESKRKIFKSMQKGVVVLNFENEISREMASSLPEAVELRYFTSGDASRIPNHYTVVYIKDGAIYVNEKFNGKSTRILELDDILLPGAHNVENYMTVIALLYGKIDNSVFSKVAKSFGGVEHRCELVREYDNVKYYNSSIDSSPTRSIAALTSFKDRNLIAIMGGYDKNIPYDNTFGDAVCKHTKAVVLTGATAGKIKAAIEECDIAKSMLPEIYMIDDFKEAVNKAKEIAENGDTVILSPASASFDKFKNFEERGRFFKETVNNF